MASCFCTLQGATVMHAQAPCNYVLFASFLIYLLLKRMKSCKACHAWRLIEREEPRHASQCHSSQDHKEKQALFNRKKHTPLDDLQSAVGALMLEDGGGTQRRF